MSIKVERVQNVPENAQNLFRVGVLRNDSNEVLTDVDFMEFLTYLGMTNFGNKVFYKVAGDIYVSVEVALVTGEAARNQLMESAGILATAIKDALYLLGKDEQECANGLLLSYDKVKEKV